MLEPNSGSHWKATNGQVVYPIPSHNGLKGVISDVYIRKLCEIFEIDFAEFRREL